MASNPEIDHSIDYYSLLSIPPSSSESEIRRAYRKTSRLYHPDKVTPTPETLQKFQLLQHAIELLTDAAERAKYDAGREAKLRREAEHAALDNRRRKMKEDLERREAGAPVSSANGNGVKRAWSDRELEMKRIQEENRKRREMVTARRMDEFKKAQVVESEDTSEIERSVKVRWVKEGDGLDVDDVALGEMFPAGQVENVVILKDKKRKVEGKGKVVLGTAVLVFKTRVAAKTAVEKGRTEELESVEWAVSPGDDKEKEKEPS